MGDKITVPRSWSGRLGIADVENSLRRRIMPLPFIANSTAGEIFGNTTTAPTLFDRNVTMEKVRVTFFLQSTATTGTTLFAFKIMSGASTVFISKKFNSTTQLSTTGWYNKEATAAGAFTKTALGSSDKLSLEVLTNSPTAQVKKVNIWLQYREALDS